MKDSISLKYLSSHLGLRKQRIVSKLEKLGLVMNDQNELSKDRTVLLLNAYVDSKQTSRETKEKARILLCSLKGEDTSDFTKQETSSKQMAQGTPYPLFFSKEGKWYLSLVRKVYIGVQTVFDECVRLLTSHRFKFLALFIAISVQIHHSAVLFYRTAPEGSSYKWTAYGYAIMVDFFIVIIALERKKAIAKVFAALTFLTLYRKKTKQYEKIYVHLDLDCCTSVHWFSINVLPGKNTTCTFQ